MQVVDIFLLMHNSRQVLNGEELLLWLSQFPPISQGYFVRLLYGAPLQVKKRDVASWGLPERYHISCGCRELGELIEPFDLESIQKCLPKEWMEHDHTIAINSNPINVSEWQSGESNPGDTCFNKTIRAQRGKLLAESQPPSNRAESDFLTLADIFGKQVQEYWSRLNVIELYTLKELLHHSIKVRLFEQFLPPVTFEWVSPETQGHGLLTIIEQFLDRKVVSFDEGIDQRARWSCNLPAVGEVDREIDFGQSSPPPDCLIQPNYLGMRAGFGWCENSQQILFFSKMGQKLQNNFRWQKPRAKESATLAFKSLWGECVIVGLTESTLTSWNRASVFHLVVLDVFNANGKSLLIHPYAVRLKLLKTIFNRYQNEHISTVHLLNWGDLAKMRTDYFTKLDNMCPLPYDGIVLAMDGAGNKAHRVLERVRFKPLNHIICHTALWSRRVDIQQSEQRVNYRRWPNKSSRYCAILVTRAAGNELTFYTFKQNGLVAINTSTVQQFNRRFNLQLRCRLDGDAFPTKVFFNEIDNSRGHLVVKGIIFVEEIMNATLLDCCTYAQLLDLKST